MRTKGPDSTVVILPSLLAADFGRLAAEARRAEAGGGDGLHIDIMDGHFVPNLSMGPDVVRMARRTVRLPLNVHLMMTRPDRYLQCFARAGADTLIIHTEAECDVPRALRRIRALGMAPGITLNPETKAEALWPVLPLVEEVLCMSVHPGYGGQKFMPSVLAKIRAIEARRRALHLPFRIAVDGGIDHATAARVCACVARVLIAGSSLFRARNMGAAIRSMRRVAEAACRA